MSCALYSQHFSFLVIWVMIRTCRLAHPQLHWLVWIDPWSVFAEALNSYRRDRARYIPPGGFLAICNCAGVHNVFSTAGVHELLLSTVLWDTRMWGFNIGILHFLEMLARCVSWLLLLAVDALVMCTAANCYLASAELPRLSSRPDGWASAARSCVKGARHVSWQSLCAAAVLTVPLVVVQLVLACTRKPAVAEQQVQERIHEREKGGITHNFASVLTTLEKKKLQCQ